MNVLMLVQLLSLFSVISSHISSTVAGVGRSVLALEEAIFGVFELPVTLFLVRAGALVLNELLDNLDTIN